MSKKNHNPTPWKIAEGMRETIVDAQNTVVANAANGKAAEFIVEAVNDHEKLHEVSVNLLRSRDAVIEDNNRLRDLVRRLADNLRRFHITGDRDRALLRAARAAIGEGAQ